MRKDFDVISMTDELEKAATQTTGRNSNDMDNIMNWNDSLLASRLSKMSKRDREICFGGLCREDRAKLMYRLIGIQMRQQARFN